MMYTGWQPTPPSELKVIEQILADLQGSPEFSDLYSHFRGSGKGKLSAPYKSVLKFFAGAFEDEAQKIGDCTSHGVRNATDISRSVEIDIKGEPEEFVARGATEGIYSFRGHSGHGMNVGRAIQFCNTFGILIRQNYDFGDLSSYNPTLATRWHPTPEAIKEEAKKHPCRYFARIRNVEEARDALANGFGIACGSGYGNKGVRDSRGRSTWNHSWNHCMAWAGADDTEDDLYFLVVNSWGKWNKGGHPNWGPIPGGSFLIPASDAARMIQSGECWAIGDTHGWPAQNLPDYGAASFLGA